MLTEYFIFSIHTLQETWVHPEAMFPSPAHWTADHSMVDWPTLHIHVNVSTGTENLARVVQQPQNKTCLFQSLS